MDEMDEMDGMRRDGLIDDYDSRDNSSREVQPGQVK